MKYEKPQVVQTTPAIEVIQAGKFQPPGEPHDASPAYEDFEE